MWIREYKPRAKRQSSSGDFRLVGGVLSLAMLVVVAPVVVIIAFFGVIFSGTWRILTAPFRLTKDGFEGWFKRWFLDRYQKWMFHANIAQSEISKPMRFYSEVVQTATLLAVLGYHVKLVEWVGIYVFIFFVAILSGKMLIDLGVVKYLTRLGNEQNPEIMEIKKSVDEIKNKLNGGNTNQV